jgi:hypothetical protein
VNRDPDRQQSTKLIEDTEKEQVTARAMSPNPAAAQEFGQAFHTDTDPGL